MFFFCFCFAVSPHLDLLPMFGPFNEARLLELLLFVFFCCCVACHPSLRVKWLTILDAIPLSSKLLMVAVVLLGCISATQAAFPSFAWLEVALFVLLFAVTLCIAACRWELGAIFDRIILLALIVMVLPCTTALFGHYVFAMSGEVKFERDVLFFNYANVRFFNQLQGWTLSLIVLPSFLFARRFPALRIFCIIAAINWWLLLFVSGGRGTLLSALVAFPVTRYLFGAKARPWFRWQIITALAGFVAYLILILLLPTVFGLDFNASQIGLLGRSFTSSSGRIGLWITALEMVVNKPWLGIGPMQYAASPSIPYAHPHNALLQLAAEWGIPAALMVLALFFWGAMRWVQHSKSKLATMEGDNLRVALFGSLLTAALYSLFDGVIVMPISQVMLVLIIGWMLGMLSFSESRSKPKPTVIRVLIASLLLAITLFGVLRPVVPTVFCLEQLQSDFIQNHPKVGNLKPRFWQQGYLSGYPRISPCD
jgi:O-antigen ligase